MGWATNWAQPRVISDVLMAFPARVEHLMPAFSEIPIEYPKRDHWEELQQLWFMQGLKGVVFEPMPGVDPMQALRHLRALQGSYEPKHEHKVAAVAYLASRWFKDWRIEREELHDEIER